MRLGHLVDVVLVLGVAGLLFFAVQAPAIPGNGTLLFDIFRAYGIAAASLIVGVSLALVRQSFVIWLEHPGPRPLLPFHIWVVALGTIVISIGYAGVLTSFIGTAAKWYGFPAADLGFTLQIIALGIIYRRQAIIARAARNDPTN